MGENLEHRIKSVMLDILVEIILNNTDLDYNGNLTIDDSKPIVEFIRALDVERYENVERTLREKTHE